jgi:hypothetical protein
MESRMMRVFGRTRQLRHRYTLSLYDEHQASAGASAWQGHRFDVVLEFPLETVPAPERVLLDSDVTAAGGQVASVPWIFSNVEELNLVRPRVHEQLASSVGIPSGTYVPIFRDR